MARSSDLWPLLVLVLAGCGGPSTPTDASVESGVDASAPADAVDSGADVADTSDTGATDSGVDVIAPVDAPVAADVLDANDAGAADAEPADAGPMVFDLSTQYAAPEFHGLYERLCDPSDTQCEPARRDTISPAQVGRATGCAFGQGRVGFEVWVCDAPMRNCGDFNGYVYPSESAGATFLLIGSTGLDTVQADRGSQYTAGGALRQNFHLQFSLAPAGHFGVTGIAGQTVSPDFGDLWLLGCPVQ